MKGNGAILRSFTRCAAPFGRSVMLEKDMENFKEYKTESLVKQESIMPNCISTRFDCQKSEKQTVGSEVRQSKHEVCTPSQASVPQSTNIPILISFKDEDNLTEDGDTSLKSDVIDTESDIVLCICCLEEDVTYVRLVNCEHAEFLNIMMMPEINPKNQVICYQCHHMLKKIKLFKLQVEESFKLLSNSSESRPKPHNQIHNFKIRQNFNINIPQNGINMEPVRVCSEIPQARIKSTKDNDDNLKEEVIKSIEKREKRPKPRSPDKQTKKSKNIEESLKIINNNQNSDCINILTNCLKNISSTLIRDFFINFDLGSHVDKTVIPEASIKEDNITASLNENNIGAKEKNTYISDASGLAINTENPAKFLGDNSSKTDTTNTAKNVPQVSLKTKIAETLKDDSIKIPKKSGIHFKNTINNTTSTVISKENLANDTEEDSTNNYLKKKHLTLEDIGKDLLLPKVNPKLAEKTTEELVKNDAVSITDENIGKILSEHYSIVENDLGGDSDQPVTEKESLGVERKEVGGGDVVQAIQSTIVLDTQPCLGSNIKQLTLTRGEVMDERAKTATSKAYLRAPHRCSSCLISFQFQENLEDHVKRKHTKGKLQCVECDICHQLVDHGSSFEMHTFWHHTRYQCTSCERLFASYDRAVFHYRKQHVKRKHHNVKSSVVFKCPRCNFKTNRNRLLKDHMSECRPTSTDVTLEESLTNSIEAPTEAKRAKITPTA